MVNVLVDYVLMFILQASSIIHFKAVENSSFSDDSLFQNLANLSLVSFQIQRQILGN